MRTIPRLTAVLACVLIAGCAPRSTRLDGAVYASSVPVYKNLKPADLMGGHYEDDEGNTISQTQTWFFDTKDSKEQVIAFYEKNFPGATKEVDEQGDVTFRLIPMGAESGESVHVTVREGQIMIGEECKPGKIKS